MKRYFFVKKMLSWFFKFIYNIKVVNPENRPPKDTPFIVASNHSHFFDVVPIGIAFDQQIHFMAKKEVFKTPILRGVAKLMGAYAVDRGAGDVSAVKKSIELLKSGESICIFPQGTRCPYIDPKETEPKDGIGMIAARAGVGIVPVCVRTKRNKMGLFRRTELVVGKYLSPDELKFPVLGGMERSHAITNLAFSQIVEMNNEIERAKISEKKIQKTREKLKRKSEHK
jgi:1-acyl-sn-glycerol-3-phosphate acyltransferase